MGKLGNSTELTDERIKKFADYIKKGLFIQTACDGIQISQRTYYNWMKFGQEGKEPYLYFFRAVQEAESIFFAQAEEAWLKSAQDVFDPVAGHNLIKKGDWRALESFLERRKPAVYRKDNTRLNDDYLQDAEKNISTSERLSLLSDQIIKKMTAGEMSVETATLVLRSIDERRKLVETVENAKKIADIENKINAK